MPSGCCTIRFRRRSFWRDERASSAPWRRRRSARGLAGVCGHWWRAGRPKQSLRAWPPTTASAFRSTPTSPRRLSPKPDRRRRWSEGARGLLHSLLHRVDDRAGGGDGGAAGGFVGNRDVFRIPNVDRVRLEQLALRSELGQVIAKLPKFLNELGQIVRSRWPYVAPNEQDLQVLFGEL